MPELNFNALATQGPQGVFQGFMQGQQLQNRLAQQEQQRQLGELQLQNALREQRLAGEEEAAWKAGAGNPQAVLQQLQQRGLGKQAMALQGQLTKQQADKLAQQKTTVELVKNAANQVFANPQNAAQILQSFSQRTGIDVSDDLNQIQQLGGDVEAIKRWAAGNALEADKLLPKFQQFDQGGAIVTGTVDPLTGKFAQGTAFQKSMAPGEAERIRNEGLRIGLEGRRVAVLEENARREADPEFQRRMGAARATGEAIAKGDVQAIQALPKVIGDAELAVGLLDQMVGKRDSKTGKLLTKDPVTGEALKNNKPHPGFAPAVGMGGFGTLGIPGLAQLTPGTDAANFKTLYDQVMGASFSEAFETLKGGGAITEKEGVKATAARNRMSLAQSEDEFIRAALEYRDIVAKGVERAQAKAARATSRMVPAAPAAGGVKFLGFE